MKKMSSTQQLLTDINYVGQLVFSFYCEGWVIINQMFCRWNYIILLVSNLEEGGVEVFYIGFLRRSCQFMPLQSVSSGVETGGQCWHRERRGSMGNKSLCYYHTCQVLRFPHKDYGFTRKIKTTAIAEQTIWFSIYLNSQFVRLVIFISFL